MAEDFDGLIENICEQGCLQVYQTITQLEQNQCPDQLQPLAPSERLAVLEELKSIMAIYKGSICSL